jgi:hypothetical protein
MLGLEPGAGKDYGICVSLRSSAGRPGSGRSATLIAGVLGVLTAVVGFVVILLSVTAPPSHVPGVSAVPTPKATATATVGSTSAAHAPPTPVQVVLPSSIAITVNGETGGLPAWASWLGPIGGFLTGIGALGGLVAFRRRKEQRDEEQALLAHPAGRRQPNPARRRRASRAPRRPGS